MRHFVFGKKLSRDISARKALLNNLANSLIINGELTTTLAKAKFAKSHVEKLVSIAKKDRLYKNRIMASKLSTEAFAKLINELGPGFIERKGGYTKITRLAPRRGDAALMARLEFVGWDKTKVKSQEVKNEKIVKDKKQKRKRPMLKRNKSVNAPTFKKKNSKSAQINT